MAVMYTANHMRVRAIVALTESGMTPLWMSRIRSDIPIYAFTRHEATRRRVTLYRGVYPVLFDITHTESAAALYSAIFARLLELRPGGAQRSGDPHQGRAVGRVRAAPTRCRSCRLLSLLAQIAPGDLPGQPVTGIHVAAQGTALGRLVNRFRARLRQGL